MTQKAELFVKSQGVRGNKNSYEKRGYATLFIDSQTRYIYVDSFKGRGDNYQQLDKCTIVIANPKGDEFVFDSFDALISHLERGAQPEIKTSTASPEEMQALADQQRKNTALFMAAPELLEAFIEKCLRTADTSLMFEELYISQQAVKKAKGE